MTTREHLEGAVSQGCLPAEATVREAKRMLSASPAPAFVVTDEDRPVGVITADRLRATTDSLRRTVADAMDFEVVPVDHGCDVVQTMRAYEAAGWASLRRRKPFAGTH